MNRNTDEKRKFLISYAYFAVIIATGLFLLKYAVKLILPFLISFGVSFLIQPLVRTLNKRYRISKKFSGVFLVTSILFIIGLLVFFIVNRLVFEVRELMAFINDEPQAINGVIEDFFGFFEELRSKIPILNTRNKAYFNDIFGGLDTFITDFLKNFASSLTAKFSEILSGFVKKLPDVAFFTVITVVSSFYISADFSGIVGTLTKKLSKKHVTMLKSAKARITNTLMRYLRAYVVIWFITFTELFVGFSVIRIEYSFTLAVIISILDILPVLGVGTVLIPWSAFLLIQKNYYTGIALLILYLTILLLRQIMEPKIVGNSIGLSPLLTLFSMYVGYKIAGIVGILSAPLFVILIKEILIYPLFILLVHFLGQKLVEIKVRKKKI